MNKDTFILLLLTVWTSVAAAGPATDNIIHLWRNAQTNEYRAIMEGRLRANSMDVAGWLMKYHWDWVFDDGGESGLSAITNTIDNLVRATESYKGPVFGMERDFFVRSIKCVKLSLLNDTRDEANRIRTETARKNWKSWRYISLYKSCFNELEQDGMFENPPRVWIEDPALYRVSEAATNLYECVTNLWMGGAITNVSLIMQNRLSTDQNDPIGLLLAMDCAYALMDAAAYRNASARLVSVIGGMTNLTVSAESVRELPEEVQSNLQSMQSLESEYSNLPIAQAYPKYAPGTAYPHLDILRELCQLP